MGDGEMGGRRSGLLFLVVFFLLVTAGIAGLMNRAVDAGFTQPFTHGLVLVCAEAMRLAGAHVQARGVILSFSDGPGAVMVSNGCNAMEVCILFAAAVLAFPAKAAARALGVVTGVAAIQLLNLLRIMSLLLLARYAQAWFSFAHLYVWDALILLDGVVLFLAWNRWQGRRRGPRLAVAA